MTHLTWLTGQGRVMTGEVVATIPPRIRPVDINWTKKAAQGRFRRVACDLSRTRLIESWLVSVTDAYGRLSELHWPRLDVLYKSHQRAFELGILPDLWLKLR